MLAGKSRVATICTSWVKECTGCRAHYDIVWAACKSCNWEAAQGQAGRVQLGVGSSKAGAAGVLGLQPEWVEPSSSKQPAAHVIP